MIQRTTGFLAAAILLFALTTTPLSAAEIEPHTFRLSSDNEQTDHVATGVYEVRILDLVPGVDYFINLETVKVKVPQPDEFTFLDQSGNEIAGCKKLKEVGEELPEGETNVPGWLKRVRTEAKKCIENGGNQQKIDSQVRKLEDLTRRSLRPHSVTRNRGIEVTVIRDDRAESWTFRLLPPTEKRWFTSYGLRALPDEDERYFAASDGADADGNAQFKITKDRNSGEDWGADGMILFTHLWQPEENWRFGASAGLGLESDNLSFFVGPSLALNDFLFLTGGLAFHEQQRLAGSLTPDDPVTQALTDQQLHVDTHDFNWFVGMTLALGSNPFKPKSKDSNGDTPTDKPAPQNDSK